MSNDRHHMIRSKCLQLFLISFITLFLELMIIRWIPSNVRLVAYYANLMLISSFLGIGLGALLKRFDLKLFRWFPLMLLVYVVFQVIAQNMLLPGMGAEMRFYATSPTVANTTVLVCIFLLNTFLFVGLGEKIGELFDALPRLRAYSWDLGGSLAGTLCFGAFSLLYFNPLIGFCLVMVLFILVADRATRLRSLLLFALALFYVYATGTPNAIWSPYHHITITQRDGGDATPLAEPPAGLLTMQDPPSYSVSINQDFYQSHGTLNPARYTPDTALYNTVLKGYSQFGLPYKIKDDIKHVLVVGAGSGKEAEVALMNGAESIDAVEIDPALIGISKRFNASGVYFDPRVHIHNNDARAFFTNADKDYDLVTFSYLDSQILFSVMSSIRLDGYVYTVESFRTAYGLLNDDGVMCITFFIQEPWLGLKLIRMVTEATGKPPLCYLRGSHLTLLSPRSEDFTAPASYNGFKLLKLNPDEPITYAPATDDWPFLYLQARSIPSDYLLVIGILIALAVYLVFSAGRLGWGIRQSHFAFLGIGFLLLQTKSITNCSLYFGTTWVVTLIVITGILFMVLLANLVAMRLKAFNPWMYAPLVLSMVVLILTPNDFILGLPFAVRLAWSLIMVPLPVFFAGLIFSTTFRESKDASACFGANLIGATIGGFLEYLGMAIGFNAVSILVIIAYLLSMLAMRRVSAQAAA
jgi:hypothetical protein